MEHANNTAQRVRAAGFNVIEEQSGQLYRVLATDVPASMVRSAIERLVSMGFRQFWVREY